ncbi:MAG TPA: carbohydrate-binding family 9-like protein [Candidatus Paceibacterota bacterium]|nr:carbohydrate-binding family 9-like protein [Candidatus Paceibacterota bacterium]
MNRKGLVPLLVWLVLTGCSHVKNDRSAVWLIPPLTEPVRVDGRLGESCYERLVPVTDFKVASRPGAKAPVTKAWLQWDERGLWFAFAAHDLTLVAAPPTRDEHAVDVQDRVELFLWPEGSRNYFCLEIAPDGAVHDYAAKVYRQFDDSWTPTGAVFAANRTADGYGVEGFIPIAALADLGLRPWRAGTRFHLGLYRADFRPGALDDPLWLTWVEPNLPQPDFHVRAAFAPVALAP